jgi:hypothetical protein
MTPEPGFYRLATPLVTMFSSNASDSSDSSDSDLSAAF